MAKDKKKKKDISKGLKVFTDLKSIPVERETKDGVEQWTLLELSGPKRDTWGNFVRERTDKDGRISNFKDYQQTLLTMCLKDPTDKFADVNTINDKFSSTAIMDLFGAALELSRLDGEEEDEDDLKND